MARKSVSAGLLINHRNRICAKKFLGVGIADWSSYSNCSEVIDRAGHAVSATDQSYLVAIYGVGAGAFKACGVDSLKGCHDLVLDLLLHVIVVFVAGDFCERIKAARRTGAECVCDDIVDILFEKELDAGDKSVAVDGDTITAILKS